MPDAEYREQASELTIALSEPHVKGVFEDRLPLELHAALHLGCVTAVAPDSRTKSLQDGFELADLQVCLTMYASLPFARHKPPAKCSERIYLCHLQSAQKQTHTHQAPSNAFC